MRVADNPLISGGARSHFLPGLRGALHSVRFYVFLACTVLAILTNFHLGKEMLWDTMDYHVYAGFSALHDRFDRDYFAAGPQGYFNPYAYLPFYLLLRSKLTPLEDASVLAALQSAILWLTFEIALLVVPRDKPRAGLAVGVLSVALAFANPVLINEFGSSYADITTAEIALAGWLLLLGTVASSGATRVVCGAVLLGAATALKLTNAVHAVSAAALLPFIPGGWRRKLRHAALYVTGVAVSFLTVDAPWALHLERHFGNPLFPLLNGFFRSSQYTSAPVLDYRFIPSSLAVALLRPFTMATSDPMVHFELSAPDVRYALVLVLALVLLIQRLWGRWRTLPHNGNASAEQLMAARVLAALGCGFLLDWTLWLTASGNSRYFIPMACVAAVLVVTLIFRLLAARPKIRNGLIAVVVAAQCVTVYAGADYRARLPWTRAPWVNLSMPVSLGSQPRLYLMLGMQSNSFIIPAFAAGSGFINLDGAYVLGPQGANGKRIEALIRRYAPHLQVIVRESQPAVGRTIGRADLDRADDTLAPFGLQVIANRCSLIVAHGVTSPPAAHTEYLLSCQVDEIGPPGAIPLPGKHAADLALDHLEDACPALLQPRRLVDTVRGDRAQGYVFARRYWNTATIAWVFHGSVKVERLFDGWKEDVGSEEAWEHAPPRISCGREGAGYLRMTKGS